MSAALFSVTVPPASNDTLNCTTNLTAYQDEGPLQANILATVITASISWICALTYIIQNICARVHNQWPQSQIQWLAYSVLALQTVILLGAGWDFRASEFPVAFCQAQGVLVQFISCAICGWFMVITLTMRQMITKQNSVHELATKFRKASLFGVFGASFVLTAIPAVMQFGVGGFVIFAPNAYNTWCWVTVCQWPYYQIILMEAEMLVVVFAGSAIALIAMCRLWDIRKYSSQNFQPRIRIYMYRRLTFIVSYAAEIIVLLLVWFVFHFTHQQSTASFIVSKAVVCSSGILLIVAFGVPDRCCLCQCRAMSELQALSSAKAAAAMLMEAEQEESARERYQRRQQYSISSEGDYTP